MVRNLGGNHKSWLSTLCILLLSSPGMCRAQSNSTNVVTNPSSSQLITQPAGTSFSIFGSFSAGENTNGTAVIDAYGGSAYFGVNGADAYHGISINPWANVGIGTPSADGELSIVAGNPSFETGTHIVNTDPTGFSVLRLSSLDTSAQTTGVALHSFNSAWPQDSASAISPSSSSLISFDSGGLVIDTLAPAPLRFFTGGYAPANERMRIDQNGHVGIGTASPSTVLEVNGGISLTRNSTGGITFSDGTVQTTALSTGSLGTVTSGTWNGSAITASYLPTNVVYADSEQTISGKKTFSNGAVAGSTQTQDQAPALDVIGYGHFSGSASPTTPVQGAYISWNKNVGTGETDFINNRGGGPGGFAFWNTEPDGSHPQEIAFMDASGSLGLGMNAPHSKLEVNGNITLTSGSGASVTFPDGSVQSTAYTGSCIATGGDYAESMNVLGNKSSYEPGDVMVLATTSGSDIAKSMEPYSTMVAGIYATKPGFVGRRQLSDSRLATKEIPMAMVGVVPTKVSTENGAIRRGDLLVTSSLPGVAMKGTDRSRMMGAVVGKAMGTLESGNGVIEVLVTLQ